ncbi:MAG: sensor histidine kinase, partial [Noviherbaspirillum sp.]
GLASASGVSLQRGGRAAEAMVNADSDRLSQVFINLISNAIKYNTSASPYVRISSGIVDGAYEVLVEDNGPGIRADERQKIFLKFSRGWTQSRSGTQGAGLGLTISWQIMRRLGGSLELMPEAGGGACFRVRLAVCQAAPALRAG